ncbi:MAG: hypothetical protein ACK5MU_02775 [Candidatus Saccharimonadales bacterium]
MLKIDSLVKRLREDFPGLIFEVGDDFKFSPPRTICYNPSFRGLPHNKIALLTLHEAAHAVLEHKDYDEDIELLKIEAAAWERAKQLCANYKVRWDEDFVQDRLDTYRDWVHSRSLCPACEISGYQDNGLRYHCAMCGKIWGGQQKRAL